MFVKLLLCSSLTIIVSVFSIDNQISKLNKTYIQSFDIIPKKYDIILTSLVERYKFYGYCYLSIRIRSRIRRIRLLLNRRYVNDIIMYNDPPKFTDDGEMIVYKIIEFAKHNDITEYIFLEYIFRGRYIIKLTYSIRDTCLFKNFYKKDEQQW